MARKSRPVDDEEAALEEGEDESPGRPIRSEHRAAMLDLKALANRIAAMPQKVRRTLPFDEETQAAFDALAAAEPTPARRRALMRAKLLLNTADPVRLQAALAGDTDAALRDQQCVAWRTRIIAGGDPEIQAFLEAYPRGDRLALRTSAREARGQGAAASRAVARLLMLLREAADAGGQPEAD